MRVRELMSKPAVSCYAEDTLDRAAQVMWDRDCGIVPVIDHNEQLCGVITDRDICMAAHFQGRRLDEIRVADVMTTEVSACRPDDDIAQAEQRMSERQVHRLPVISEDGAPVGMISVSDVVQRVATNQRPSKSKGTDDECLTTIAAICEPRSKAWSADQRAF